MSSGLNRVWAGAEAWLIALATLPSVTAATNGTPMAAEVTPAFVLEIQPKDQDGFWDILATQLARNGDRIAIDRLGYPASLDLVRDINRDKYRFHQDMAFVGTRVFASVARDSLRETCMAALPIVDWLDYGNSFAAQMFAGSIGNTLEEHAYSVSASPTYAVLELSRRYAGWEYSTLDYGIRPWRMEPYAYCSLSLGHLGGKPVLLDTRCYTLLDSRKVGLMRLQEQAVIPLFDSCQFVIGVSVYPTEMNSRDQSPSALVRLERVVKIGRHSGIWYIGAQSGPHETKCNVGFAILGG